MNILIRNIEKRDIESVIHLLQHVSKFEPGKERYSCIWKKFDSQNDACGVVAEKEREIVGYGEIFIRHNIRGGGIGYVEDIVVKPIFRNNGIGKLLLDRLYSLAIREGCYKLSLQCKERNIAFYESCGFNVSGVAMQRFLKGDN